MGIAFAACSPSVKVPEPVEGPSLELSSIDSLMWKQPDSALAQLQRFVASPAADSLDVFNGHYCQLLISELLYKNYKQQSNRDDLLLAVEYFDSIVAADGTDIRKPDAHGMSIQELNVFFDARAHYINGAGYYERGEVVNACAEYLKALEIMEEHFNEKALTGKKAIFMFLINNRLLELFSAQFMMDPALTCGEIALAYCRKVPSLSKEIPNTYFHIGKQYDKKGEKDVAKSYYEKAIEKMPDTNSPIYRDAVSMKALCDYQLGLGAEQSLNTMKQSLAFVKDERERVARFLVIGSVYSEEGIYDSALRYFELAFKDETDATSKIRAAENIRVVYDSLGDREKANEFMRYLTDHKESEGKNKALVSKLEDLFKTYTIQKQEKEAEAKRETTIKKVSGIIIPIAAVLALIIIVLAKLRSKKLLKEQQEEADRILGETEQEHEKELRLWQAEADKTLEETKKKYEEEIKVERQIHEMQQKALSGKLKKSNEALQNAMQQFDLGSTHGNRTPNRNFNSFIEASICRTILETVHQHCFKSKIDYINYKEFALTKEQLLALRDAADVYMDSFTYRLRKRFSRLTDEDVTYCCFYLLDITDADIAALIQKAYPTVCERKRKIKRIIGEDDNLGYYLRNLP
jgi:tetratricopeptide (TPR) repeat protein